MEGGGGAGTLTVRWRTHHTHSSWLRMGPGARWEAHTRGSLEGGGQPGKLEGTAQRARHFQLETRLHRCLLRGQDWPVRARECGVLTSELRATLLPVAERERPCPCSTSASHAQQPETSLEGLLFPCLCGARCSCARDPARHVGGSSQMSPGSRPGPLTGAPSPLFFWSLLASRPRGTVGGGADRGNEQDLGDETYRH